LHVESRLPRAFTTEGLRLEIAPPTCRERLVGDLCSIRHDARWTLGTSSGAAIVDLVPAASDLTELIVQIQDEARMRPRVLEQRRARLRRFVVALRGAILDQRHDVGTAEPPAMTSRPWRTPA